MTDKQVGNTAGCKTSPALTDAVECEHKINDVVGLSSKDSGIVEKEMTMSEEIRAEWYIKNAPPDDTKEQRYREAEERYNDEHSAEWKRELEADQEYERKYGGFNDFHEWESR
jgi:hypothetical protein